MQQSNQILGFRLCQNDPRPSVHVLIDVLRADLASEAVIVSCFLFVFCHFFNSVSQKKVTKKDIRHLK